MLSGLRDKLWHNPMMVLGGRISPGIELIPGVHKDITGVMSLIRFNVALQYGFTLEQRYVNYGTKK